MNANGEEVKDRNQKTGVRSQEMESDTKANGHARHKNTQRSSFVPLRVFRGNLFFGIFVVDLLLCGFVSLWLGIFSVVSVTQW